MDPDDHDAEIAEIKIRGHITDTVFPDEGWTGDGLQKVLENLARIYENEEARGLLVAEILEMLQGRSRGDHGVKFNFGGALRWWRGGSH